MIVFATPRGESFVLRIRVGDMIRTTAAVVVALAFDVPGEADLLISVDGTAREFDIAGSEHAEKILVADPEVTVLAEEAGIVGSVDAARAMGIGGRGRIGRRDRGRRGRRRRGRRVARLARGTRELGPRDDVGNLGRGERLRLPQLFNIHKVEELREARRRERCGTVALGEEPRVDPQSDEFEDECWYQAGVLSVGAVCRELREARQKVRHKAVDFLGDGVGATEKDSAENPETS